MSFEQLIYLRVKCVFVYLNANEVCVFVYGLLGVAMVQLKVTKVRTSRPQSVAHSNEDPVKSVRHRFCTHVHTSSKEEGDGSPLEITWLQGYQMTCQEKYIALLNWKLKGLAPRNANDLQSSWNHVNIFIPIEACHTVEGIV